MTATPSAPPSGPHDPDLAAWRAQIDLVDASLVELLGRRFELTRAIGDLKAAQGLPARDEAREAAKVAGLRELADSRAVDPDLVERVMAVIMAQAVTEHERARSTLGPPRRSASPGP